MSRPTKPRCLGEVVMALRSGAGLTRDALAAATGISLVTLRRMEQGRLQPAWPILEKLCAHPSMRTLIEVCVREGIDLGQRPSGQGGQP